MFGDKKKRLGDCCARNDVGRTSGDRLNCIIVLTMSCTTTFKVTPTRDLSNCLAAFVCAVGELDAAQSRAPARSCFTIMLPVRSLSPSVTRLERHFGSCRRFS